MINLILSGALGNQMFEYAYARALSHELGDEQIVVNTYYNRFFELYMKLIKGKPEYLKYQLDLFELNPKVRTMSAPKGIIQTFGEIVPSLMIRFGNCYPETTQERYTKKTYNGKFKVLDYEHAYFKHSETCRKKNKRVLGWFQSEKYFSNIRPILLKEFQFRSAPSAANQEMIDEISECNSVCVHIRRGDLLNPHYAYFARCDEKYFQQGMEYISGKIKNPIFYIFSNHHDDIEWIKNNYNFGGFNVKYVDLGNSGYDDMRIMYNCKHFIISKSSFSWWGSYMSQNENKIVVAPEMEMEKCWLKDKNRDGFYRNDMTKICSNSEDKQ